LATATLSACSANVGSSASALWDNNGTNYVDHSDIDSLDHNVVVSVAKTQGGASVCTGLLITPRLVLTAASCTNAGKAGSSPWVRVGAKLPFTQTVATKRVISFAADPSTEPSLSGRDLALLLLSDPVYEQARARHPQFQPALPSGPAAASGSEPFANMVLTGWSPLDAGGGQQSSFVSSRQLMSLSTLQMWRYAQISSGSEPFLVVKPFTDNGDLKYGLAPGDNGAPLFTIDNASRWNVVGIASIIGDPPDPNVRAQGLPALGADPIKGSRCATSPDWSTPGSVTSCDAWVDITSDTVKSWVRANALDTTRGPRWLRMHPALPGSESELWIGDADYVGPCDTTGDPDCDHVLTNNPDGSPRDNCPTTYNPDQLDTTDAGFGDACIPPTPAQLIAPLSTSTVTSRRPLLRWKMPTGATNPIVDICATRACSSTIATVTVDAAGTSGTPTADLPTGTLLWRVRTTTGAATGISSVWEFSVGAHSATAANTSWGTTLDVNGDGFPDLAVADPYAGSGTGRVYVFHGTGSGLSTTPSSTIIGSGGWFGGIVASAGDVNGDGYADIVVGAAHVGGSNGAAYVYLGGPSGLGASPSPASTLSPPANGRFFGNALTSAGDINGDGYADVAVLDSTPVPGQPSGVTGALYVYYGSPNGFGAAPAAPTPIQSNTGLYGPVTAADVNGDGNSDVIVGATKLSSSVAPGVVVVYRSDGSALNAASPTILANPGAYALGSNVVAGDFNGDGYADVAAAALFYQTRGTTTGGVLIFAGGPSMATSPVAGWGTIASPVVQSYYGFGSVLAVGDYDGNGYTDLAVGALASATKGAVYVYSASAAGLGASFTSPSNPNDSTGADFAVSLVGGGDFNRDGFADLVAGTDCYSKLNGSCVGGAVYTFTGSTGGIVSGEVPAPTWGTLKKSDSPLFGAEIY
jgi:hypothetical protein